jgi:hypothetical protein
MGRLPFRAVWAVDFEFAAPPGERPTPLCVVARELRSGALARHWLTGGAPAFPPFGTGPDALFVAYYASAELGCHLALDWPMPARVLDLYAEFRCLTSGLPVPCGHGLLGALAAYGLDGIGAAEKEEMRQLAMRGGAYTVAEREALLSYCQSDVDALARLLPAMLPQIDLPRALLRGRYMTAAARMEWVGVPMDTETLDRLRRHWDRIKARLTHVINKDYDVYVPANLRVINPQTRLGAAILETARKWGVDPHRLADTADDDLPSGPMRFSSERWAAYLTRKGIPWPRLDSGALDLSDDTFREMARSYPKTVGPIRELRHTLSQLRLNELTVGSDGRNRCLLSAFQSRTGRNQPSNSRFIFGPSTWLRSLICPEPGRAVAYVDWSAQELGIAAALSGDRRMQEAYRSGDPYLWLAKHVGAVPPDATKATHGATREQFKVVSLGVLYGLSAEGLARKLNVPPCYGWELLRSHQQTFRVFWGWSDRIEAEAMLTGRLRTVFGWTVHVGVEVNPRSFRNFPMQGNGAEMMRLACCLLTEQGIRVCAPIHDALLVEGPAGGIADVVAATTKAMREASELVLPGFPLRSEAKVIRHPERYADGRGKAMWESVLGLLEDEVEASSGVAKVLQGVLP